MTGEQLLRELESDLKYLAAIHKYLIEMIATTEKMISNLSCRIVKLKEDKSK